MKIRHAALNALIDFLYMLGSCFAVMLVEALLVFIINKFVFIPYPVLTVMRIIIYSVGVTAIMGLLGYSEGYREGHCSIGESVLGGTLALIPHVILAMLFKFQAFVSGAVRFTAGLIHNGRSITYEKLINETPYSLFLLVFFVYGAVYITSLTVMRYLGAQNRVIDLAEMRKNQKPAS